MIVGLTDTDRLRRGNVPVSSRMILPFHSFTFETLWQTD